MKPKKLEVIRWHEVMSVVDAYVESVEKGDEWSDAYYTISEKVFEVVFGNRFWDWYNDNT